MRIALHLHLSSCEVGVMTPPPAEGFLRFSRGAACVCPSAGCVPLPLGLGFPSQMTPRLPISPAPVGCTRIACHLSVAPGPPAGLAPLPVPGGGAEAQRGEGPSAAGRGSIRLEPSSGWHRFSHSAAAVSRGCLALKRLSNGHRERERLVPSDSKAGRQPREGLAFQAQAWKNWVTSL